MSTIEKLSIPAGCSLEFTGPTGKPIKIMSVDELKDVIAKTEAAKKSETGDLPYDLPPKEEIEKRRVEIVAAIKSVYEVMFANKCPCRSKDMYSQFAFFVNNILMPNTHPGYKCLIFPIMESTLDIEGNLISASNKGVHIIFHTIDDYNKYWAERKAADKKCLANRNDMKKIGEALEPTRRKTEHGLIIPLSQLLLDKNCSNRDVAAAIDSFISFIKSEYGVNLRETVVGTDDITGVLNSVIKFVNKKFKKNIKLIKDSAKLERRVNVCINILKILKAIKQSKKED